MTAAETALKLASADPGIAMRRLKALMAQKSCHQAQIHAPFHQVGRTRMPEKMRSDLQAQTSAVRSHSGMQAIARSLSDQDIADLAAFYGSGK